MLDVILRRGFICDNDERAFREKKRDFEWDEFFSSSLQNEKNLEEEIREEQSFMERKKK